MPPKPGRIGRLYRERPGALPAVFAVLLGLILIAMAAPRLVAGILMAPHDELARGLSRENIGGGEALAKASADYEEALSWDDEANSAAQLATFNYLLAQSVGFDSEAGKTWLRRTLSAARRAVAGNPAQPYTWVQIALALERLEGTSERSVAALMESIRRGAMQPRLAVLRSGLALRAWPLLEQAERRLAAGQILLAAEVDPAALASVVPSPSLWRVVQDVLLPTPDLLHAVEAARTPT